MEIWPNAIPWTISAIAVFLTLRQHLLADSVSREKRLRDLEVAQITDRLQHQAELTLLKSQIASATETISKTHTLLTAALNNGK